MFRKAAVVASLSLAVLTAVPALAWAAPTEPGPLGSMQRPSSGLVPGAVDRQCSGPGEGFLQSVLMPSQQQQCADDSISGEGAYPMPPTSDEDSVSGNGQSAL